MTQYQQGISKWYTENHQLPPAPTIQLTQNSIPGSVAGINPPPPQQPPPPPSGPPPPPPPTDIAASPATVAEEQRRLSQLQQQAQQWQQEKQWREYQEQLAQYHEQVYLQTIAQTNSELNAALLEEQQFNVQYDQWKQQFEDWKKDNKNHPNKEQYRQYEAQWKQYETQMEAQRAQLLSARRTVLIRHGIQLPDFRQQQPQQQQQQPLAAPTAPLPPPPPAAAAPPPPPSSPQHYSQYSAALPPPSQSGYGHAAPPPTHMTTPGLMPTAAAYPPPSLAGTGMAHGTMSSAGLGSFMPPPASANSGQASFSYGQAGGATSRSGTVPAVSHYVSTNASLPPPASLGQMPSFQGPPPMGTRPTGAQQQSSQPQASQATPFSGNAPPAFPPPLMSVPPPGGRPATGQNAPLMSTASPSPSIPWQQQSQQQQLQQASGEQMPPHMLAPKQSALPPSLTTRPPPPFSGTQFPPPIATGGFTNRPPVPLQPGPSGGSMSAPQFQQRPGSGMGQAGAGAEPGHDSSSNYPTHGGSGDSGGSQQQWNNGGNTGGPGTWGQQQAPEQQPAWSRGPPPMLPQNASPSTSFTNQQQSSGPGLLGPSPSAGPPPAVPQLYSGSSQFGPGGGTEQSKADSTSSYGQGSMQGKVQEAQRYQQQNQMQNQQLQAQHPPQQHQPASFTIPPPPHQSMPGRGPQPTFQQKPGGSGMQNDQREQQQQQWPPSDDQPMDTYSYQQQDRDPASGHEQQRRFGGGWQQNPGRCPPGQSQAPPAATPQLQHGKHQPPSGQAQGQPRAPPPFAANQPPPAFAPLLPPCTAVPPPFTAAPPPVVAASTQQQYSHRGQVAPPVGQHQQGLPPTVGQQQQPAGGPPAKQPAFSTAPHHGPSSAGQGFSQERPGEPGRGGNAPGGFNVRQQAPGGFGPPPAFGPPGFQENRQAGSSTTEQPVRPPLLQQPPNNLSMPPPQPWGPGSGMPPPRGPRPAMPQARQESFMDEEPGGDANYENDEYVEGGYADGDYEYDNSGYNGGERYEELVEDVCVKPGLLDNPGRQSARGGAGLMQANPDTVPRLPGQHHPIRPQGPGPRPPPPDSILGGPGIMGPPPARAPFQRPPFDGPPRLPVPRAPFEGVPRAPFQRPPFERPPFERPPFERPPFERPPFGPGNSGPRPPFQRPPFDGARYQQRPHGNEWQQEQYAEEGYAEETYTDEQMPYGNEGEYLEPPYSGDEQFGYNEQFGYEETQPEFYEEHYAYGDEHGGYDPHAGYHDTGYGNEVGYEEGGYDENDRGFAGDGQWEGNFRGRGREHWHPRGGRGGWPPRGGGGDGWRQQRGGGHMVHGDGPPPHFEEPEEGDRPPFGRGGGQRGRGRGMLPIPDQRRGLPLPDRNAESLLGDGSQGSMRPVVGGGGNALLPDPVGLLGPKGLLGDDLGRDGHRQQDGSGHTFQGAGEHPNSHDVSGNGRFEDMGRRNMRPPLLHEPGLQGDGAGYQHRGGPYGADRPPPVGSAAAHGQAAAQHDRASLQPQAPIIFDYECGPVPQQLRPSGEPYKRGGQARSLAAPVQLKAEIIDYGHGRDSSSATTAPPRQASQRERSRSPVGGGSHQWQRSSASVQSAQHGATQWAASAPTAPGASHQNVVALGGMGPPPKEQLFDAYAAICEQETIDIKELIWKPGRSKRPARICIIVRGPPGSGKTYISKLIRDKEGVHGGSAPRILSLDDYFMVEVERLVSDDGGGEGGRQTKKKMLEYEYEADMEDTYRKDLVRTFKKTVEKGYFSFIIVDANNDKVKHVEEFSIFSKQSGFQVYVVDMLTDVEMCVKRDTHKRNRKDIEKVISGWEKMPPYFTKLDVRSLLQDDAITEVEMEEDSATTTNQQAGGAASEEARDKLQANSATSGDLTLVSATATASGALATGALASDVGTAGGDTDEVDMGQHQKSKWELETCEEKLDKLDGLLKKKHHEEGSEEGVRNMEDFLRLPDDYDLRTSEPGKKRVRWADMEEKRKQDRERQLGFVIGHTNWERVLDDDYADKALARTKYI